MNLKILIHLVLTFTLLINIGSIVSSSSLLSTTEIQCAGIVSVGPGNWLNVRSRASTGSEIVGSLEDGQRILIQSRSLGEKIEGNEIWYYINGFGYVSGAYIQLISPGHPFWCLNYKW